MEMQRRANSPIVNIPDDLVEKFKKAGYKPAKKAAPAKTPAKEPAKKAAPAK